MNIDAFMKKNRKKGIFVIIMISFFFILIIFSRGIEYEFNEEDFLPSNEVVMENERILREYTNEYLVPILVISKEGNVLSKDALLEILHIEKNLYERFGVEPISVADVISLTLLSLSNETDKSYEKRVEIINGLSNEEIIKFINSPFFPSTYLSLLLSTDFNGQAAEACVIKFSLNGSLIKNDAAAMENESIIREIVEKEYEYIEAHVLGARIISEEIIIANNKSISILLPISFLLVILVLTMVHKNIIETFLSLVALGLTIIWIIGLAVLLNYHLNPITTSIPVLLVGLGIDYGIHIKKRINEEGIKGLRSIFPPLVLSATTTSIAFLSNISSSIPVMKEFGILSSFGIFSCFLIMLFFLSYGGKKRERKEGMELLALKIEKAQKGIIAAVVVITFLMLAFSTTIEAEFDMTDFLPEKLDISRNIEYLLNNFKAAEGEKAIIILKENMTEPENLRKLYSIERNIRNDEFVTGEITSILSLMKDYAEKTVYDMRYNESFARLYNVYFDDGMVKNNISWKEIKMLYDTLFSIAPDDIKRVLHPSYEESIIRIATDTGKKEKNIEILYRELKKDLNDSNGIVTGGIISSYVVLKEFRNSQLKSLLITAIISFLILEAVFLWLRKSFTLGILAILPVILSAIWITGSMALLGIPLTVMTITVASLAVGLGIDYSIHITYHFIQHHSIVKTISSTGVALLGSALTTIAAFSLLSFSPLPPLQQFGISIALAITYNFFLCVFVLPAMLNLFPSFE
ncbi:MAG: MMPL family transporter [Thermoplasmata archaeon]|nr:MMPL family transporter [Thermoplasmata archaeon]